MVAVAVAFVGSKFVSGIYVQLVFHNSRVNTGHLFGAEGEDITVLL